MLKLNLNSLRKIAFPDTSVLDVHFDPINKSLTIFVESAWYEEHKDDGRWLGKGNLQIKGWKKVVFERFNHELNRWEELSSANFEKLKDICEFSISGQTITIAGFGKLFGMWIKYTFVESDVEAEFAEYL